MEEKIEEKASEVLVINEKIESLDLPVGKAAQIKAAFDPMLKLLSEYEAELNEINSKIISPEVCKQAKKLRLKYRDIRTATAEIHKTQKDEFRRAGLAIDGFKNIVCYAVVGHEEELEKKEKHYEIEAKKQADSLRETRIELLKPFYENGEVVATVGMNFGEMTEEVFQNYLTAVKTTYEAKAEAAKLAAEEEQKKQAAIKLHNERKNSILELWKYVSQEDKQLDFGVIEEKEWKKKISAYKAAKAEEDKKQKELADANAKLLKEKEKADKVAKEAKEKADKLQKEADDKKAKEEAAKKAEDSAKRKANRAPDKDKLNSLIDELELPFAKLKDEDAMLVYEDIKNRFTGFKNWAKKEIKSKLE